MLQSILLGGSFAFAAGIQPGPLQAFLLSRVAANGWKRTLPACLAPLVSDGPIAVLALLVLRQFPPAAQQVLRVAGGCLLLYLGWAAFRQLARQPGTSEARATPRTVLQAAFVNLLNPNPYLGWSLVLGPATLVAWRQSPAHAVAFVVAFYGTMVATLALFIVMVGTTHFLSPRGQRAVLAVSASLLVALGVYFLASGTITLAPTT